MADCNKTGKPGREEELKLLKAIESVENYVPAD
jgi:hypothetical protein